MGCSAPAAAAKSKAVPFGALFAPRLTSDSTTRPSGATALTPGIQVLLLKRPSVRERPSWMAPLSSVSFDTVPALQVLLLELWLAHLRQLLAVLPPRPYYLRPAIVDLLPWSLTKSVAIWISPNSTTLRKKSSLLILMPTCSREAQPSREHLAVVLGLRFTGVGLGLLALRSR